MPDEVIRSKCRSCPRCGSDIIEYDGRGKPRCCQCHYRGECWHFIPVFGRVVSETESNQIRKELMREVKNEVSTSQIHMESSTESATPNERQEDSPGRSRRAGRPRVADRLVLGRSIENPWEDPDVRAILLGPGTSREKALLLGVSHVTIANWRKKL